MANLIITIIAIALVAVAALMGAYYGGTAFNSGQDAARATSLVNQAAQIQAAAQMLVATENETLLTIVEADLDGTTAGYDTYLNGGFPGIDGTNWNITTAGTITWGGTISEAMCDAIDGTNGFTVTMTAVNDCATATLITFAL